MWQRAIALRTEIDVANASLYDAAVFEGLLMALRATGRSRALGVASTYPVALGAMKTPGAMGADIVTGEGRSLGLPLSVGGPHLGFMAAGKELVRRMPGRIVGAAEDRQGRRGFVLTRQARAQHIRRQKATSNIRTNQARCALRALIFLTLLGRRGMVELSERCGSAAAYAFRRLTAISGVSATFDTPFFNEFALTLPRDAADEDGVKYMEFVETVSRSIAQRRAVNLPLRLDLSGE